MAALPAADPHDLIRVHGARENNLAVSDIDLTQLFDDSKSLNEGAITVPGYTGGGWNSRLYSESGFVDPDKPIRDYTATELHDFLRREPTRIKIAGINMTYEGLIPRIQRSMLSKDREAMQPRIRAFVDRAVTFTDCPECGGTRLTAPPHRQWRHPIPNGVTPIRSGDLQSPAPRSPSTRYLTKTDSA